MLRSELNLKQYFLYKNSNNTHKNNTHKNVCGFSVKEINLFSYLGAQSNNHLI